MSTHAYMIFIRSSPSRPFTSSFSTAIFTRIALSSWDNTIYSDNSATTKTLDMEEVDWFDGAFIRFLLNEITN